eukprot:jgi/Ulvmu1/11401/UM075_0063.1
MCQPDTASVDGYDGQTQTNHLSHILLASMLLPNLERAAEARGSARCDPHERRENVAAQVAGIRCGAGSQSLCSRTGAAWARTDQLEGRGSGNVLIKAGVYPCAWPQRPACLLFNKAVRLCSRCRREHRAPPV